MHALLIRTSRCMSTYVPGSALSRPMSKDNNIPKSIESYVGRGLLHQEHHPLRIIKVLVKDYFDEKHKSNAHPQFTLVDNLHPVVTVKSCFDDLLTPKDHVSRSFKDNYFVDTMHLLRPHTSAHQTELLRKGYRAFLCAGDVYRRDTIDATHYPVFHQMEGLRVFPDSYTPSASTGNSQALAKYAEDSLKETLEGLVKHLFGKDTKTRWVDATFPFTNPSFELEIWFNDKWMEVLGCGVVQKKILESCGLEKNEGWAFGIGLERLAMALFDIPDIRLFWTNDERFHSQFKGALENIRKGKGMPVYKPFSKYPASMKDISFWMPKVTKDESELPPSVHENDFCSIVRSVAGDIVEEVKLVDTFAKKEKDGSKRHSACYRITFRSMERTLTNEEINKVLGEINQKLTSELNVQIR